MGRGLGERQRAILALLDERPGDWVPLYELATDPDDPNEMAKARSSVRALERRHLVKIIRMDDPSRRVDTTSVVQEGFRGWEPVYTAVPNSRAWSGMHVCRVQPGNREPNDLDKYTEELLRIPLE